MEKWYKTSKMKEKNEKEEVTTVSGSVLPDVVSSEKKLREMAELHKPKVDNSKSDFYLAWRLCYEWMSGTDH